MTCNLKILAQLFLCFCLMLHCRQTFAQPLPELIPYVDNGKWGYADTNGNVRIKPQWDKSEMFVDGKAKVWFRVEYPWHAALIDNKGNYIIPPKRNWNGRKLHYFAEKKETMRYNAGSKRKLGIIDVDNKEVIPCVYTYHEDDTYGPEWKNHSGKFIYDSLRNRFCAIVKKNGKFGLIDTANRILVPIKYSGLYRVFDERNCPAQFYIIVKGKKMGLIDTANNVILPTKYDHISYYSYDNSFRLTKNKRNLIADSTGRITIDIPGYSAINRQGKFIVVSPPGRHLYGLMNEQHELVMPCVYSGLRLRNDTITAFKDSVENIVKNQRYQYLKYFDCETFQPISDWFTEDPGITGIPRPEPTRKQQLRNGSNQLYINRRHVFSFIKDGIEWVPSVYSGYAVQGKSVDSIAYIAILDDAGNFVLSPRKSEDHIKSYNVDDKLLIMEDTAGNNYITDFNLNTKSRVETNIINTFEYGGKIYMVTDNRSRAIIVDGDPLEILSGYELLSFCNKYGEMMYYNKNIRGKFEGYFLVKRISDQTIGILDIEGKVLFPNVSFKYQALSCYGGSIFCVQTKLTEHRFSRNSGVQILNGVMINGVVQQSPLLKGEPYLINLNNEVLLDSTCITAVAKGAVYEDGQLQFIEDVYEVYPGNPGAKIGVPMSDYKEVFYVDKYGRAYTSRFEKN